MKKLFLPTLLYFAFSIFFLPTTSGALSPWEQYREEMKCQQQHRQQKSQLVIIKPTRKKKQISKNTKEVKIVSKHADSNHKPLFLSPKPNLQIPEAQIHKPLKYNPSITTYPHSTNLKKTTKYIETTPKFAFPSEHRNTTPVTSYHYPVNPQKTSKKITSRSPSPAVSLNKFQQDQFTQSVNSPVIFTLEKGRTGEMASWITNGRTYNMRVIRTYYKNPQSPCREYTLQVVGQPNVTTYSACRNQYGEWTIH